MNKNKRHESTSVGRVSASPVYCRHNVTEPSHYDDPISLPIYRPRKLAFTEAESPEKVVPVRQSSPSRPEQPTCQGDI